jgi:hypothetical protein
MVSPPVPSFAGPSRTVRCERCGRKIIAVDGYLCAGCQRSGERQAVHTLRKARRAMQRAERRWSGKPRRWWWFW